MQIKWRNLIALALALATTVFALAMLKPIAAALSSLRDIGPDSSPQEKTMGLMCLGLILVSILGIVRIVCSKD